MAKINHARSNKMSKKFLSAQYDYCCGKRGERRNQAGQKKFYHSRNRANVKQGMLHVDHETDLSEVKFDNSLDRRIMDLSKTSGSITAIAIYNDPNKFSGLSGEVSHYTKN